ncbi:MAG: preprotein translocase subunit SecE [Bacteroidales bacterium]|nr:preprotein translocase subunit SecE [Bacteroidales bacterium]
MSKISLYFKESYTELTKKVSWPSWASLQSSAILVMVASVIFALVIFAMDFCFRHLMTFIYQLLY